jgi:hypothetical protein
MLYNVDLDFFESDPSLRTVDFFTMEPVGDDTITGFTNWVRAWCETALARCADRPAIGCCLAGPMPGHWHHLPTAFSLEVGRLLVRAGWRSAPCLARAGVVHCEIPQPQAPVGAMCSKLSKVLL